MQYKNTNTHTQINQIRLVYSCLFDLAINLLPRNIVVFFPLQNRQSKNPKTTTHSRNRIRLHETMTSIRIETIRFAMTSV